MCHNCTLCSFPKCYNRCFQYKLNREQEDIFYEDYNEQCESGVQHPDIGEVAKCVCCKTYCFVHWLQYKKKYGLKLSYIKLLKKCDLCNV